MVSRSKNRTAQVVTKATGTGMTNEIFQGHRSVVQFQPKSPGSKWRIAGPILKAVYANIIFRNTKPLFVLGCMRSGSTLLSHILMSHPEIFGVGESHVVWRDHKSLHDVMAEALRLRRELPAPRKYLLDKILHSHLTPNLDALTAIKGTRIIVLLRRPPENIASISKIINAGGVPVACEEYCGRMKDLDLILKSLENPVCLLVEYERLVSEPETVLHEVQDFLDLSTPLDQRYKLTRVSGKWGYGDGSPDIRQGKIVAKNREAVAIAPDALITAEALYDRVWATAQRLQASDDKPTDPA